MKKGVKILLTVFNFLAVGAMILFGISFIFLGLFGEALVAVFTLGHGDADGQILALFVGPAFLLFAVAALGFIGTILFIVTFKKPLKGLQIAVGGVFAATLLALLGAFIWLMCNLGFSNDNIKAYLVVGIIVLLNLALYGCTAIFGGFLPAFKKQEAAPEVEEVK